MQLKTVAVTALGLSLSAVALGQDAAEVEAILYRAADTLGMLRTPREVDRLATMIYWGTGETVVDGAPCALSRYRASVRYPIAGQQHSFPVPGMRVEIDCARDGAEPERHVHVVAGEYAWNETAPGIGATPAPETVRERLLQLWLLPQGLVKAAKAAGSSTTAGESAGNATLTFPLPAPLEDTRVEITLDPQVFLYHTMPNGVRREFSHRIVRVATDLDGDAVEVSYSDYRDFNPDDYKADVLLPGRIVQTRNGRTTLDLTLTESNTYNPYVIMPVPGNVH